MTSHLYRLVPVLGILCVTYICDASPLYVIDEGTEPVKGNDIAFKLYMTVNVNDMDTDWPSVTLTDYQCCMHLDPNKDDPGCQSMILFLTPEGDDNLAIPTRNITFLLPNRYPHNRIGECLVKLEIGNVNIDHLIKINSTLESRNRCVSPDENPFHDCRPIECALKYGGWKNYLNDTTRLCEPVPDCPTSKDLAGIPDKAYDPKINACVDLKDNNRLSAEDRAYLRKYQIPFPKEPISIDTYPYVCVHGRSVKVGRGCVCEWGWTSKNVEDSVKDNVIYLCDVGLTEYYLGQHRRDAFIYIALGAVGTVLFIIVIHCICQKKHDFDYIGTLQKSTSEDVFSDDELLNGEYHHFFRCARVHTPNYPLEDGELDLKIGDLVNDLAATDTQGTWLGTCNGVRGTFPAGCAQVYLPGERPPGQDDT